MAEGAFDDPCTLANPRIPLIPEIKEILVNAHYGTTESERRGMEQETVLLPSDFVEESNSDSEGEEEPYIIAWERKAPSHHDFTNIACQAITPWSSNTF